MNRRNFVRKTAMAGMLSFTMPSFARGISSSEYDKYGGWTGKKFKATGFFRVEKDERWWIVTPEGNAFISFGINHYHAGWWAQDYNLNFWLEKFRAERFGDKYWEKGFREMALADMRTLGLNTLGIHTNAPSLTDPPLGPVMPYVRRYEPIILSHYRNPGPEAYVDIFNSSFEKQCDEAALEMAAPYADDPMLLGYCMADIPIMTDTDAGYFKTTTWPRELRNKGARSEGKKNWVKLMQERYKDILEFNSTYSTTFKNWGELATGENWYPPKDPASQRERDDNIAFLKVCVDKYYSVAKASLRKVDTNHMFFGDKINANSNTLETIVEVTSKYTDLVFYQYYARWRDQQSILDKFSAKVNRPFLNGDSTYTVPNDMLPAPYGQHAKDHAERADWIREFCEGAFTRTDFVGWHMCGVIDTWKIMPGKEKNQHQGIMSVKGEMYPDEVMVIKDISSRLYKLAIKYCR